MSHRDDGSASPSFKYPFIIIYINKYIYIDCIDKQQVNNSYHTAPELAASATKGCASRTSSTATTATCRHGAGACGAVRSSALALSTEVGVAVAPQPQSSQQAP